MPQAELIGAALILTLGVTLQTAVGFGLGLLCVPMLVWSGRSLPEAVAILIGAGCIQTGLGSFSLRSQVSWRRVLPITLVIIAVMPLGQYAMGLIVGEGKLFVKQVIGVMLLILLVARALYKPVQQDVVARAWGHLAAAVSGFLTGLVGMGGPPLVLFALAHTWSKDQYRAFIWPVFFCTTPVLICMLALQFGSQLFLEFAKGLAMAPCVWLGLRAGMAISRQWNMAQLQLSATLLLYAVAISSILGPLL